MKLTQFRYFHPPAWFPSDNPISTAVARLCISREDLYIELLGLAANEVTLTIDMDPPMPSPDDNGDAYRRLYFMRASLRTLMEIKNALFVLERSGDFRERYEKWDRPRYKQLRDFSAELNKNLDELKRIRDGICGHILPKAIEKALETMPLTEVGQCVLGEKMKETHFGFAGTILVQVLLQDVPRMDHQDHLSRMFSLNMKTTRIINDVFRWYLEDRGLLNPK